MILVQGDFQKFPSSSIIFNALLGVTTSKRPEHKDPSGWLVQTPDTLVASF